MLSNSSVGWLINLQFYVSFLFTFYTFISFFKFELFLNKPVQGFTFTFEKKKNIIRYFTSLYFRIEWT